MERIELVSEMNEILRGHGSNPVEEIEKHIGILTGVQPVLVYMPLFGEV